MCRNSPEAPNADDTRLITLWSIDSFEGGKGSRAQYLQNAANALFKGRNCYVVVTSLSAEAARQNISEGNIPDMLSYGAGFYGIDKHVNARDFAYKTWCRGGYCLLALDGSADFSDVNKDNTVINAGRENLTAACALLIGVHGAEVLNSTSAYVSLINSKFKYLLGTQRDIFRLKTRDVAFKMQPIREFNDLYQNISILTDGENYALCLEYVNYLLGRQVNLNNIGMLADGIDIYDDEMAYMQDISFEYTLNGFVGENYFSEIKRAEKSGDINLLKNLLK